MERHRPARDDDARRALDADVLVFVSDVWQTTCTAVRAADEGFVIDSPVYPEELRALPEVLEQAGFPVSGLLATHGDWDHLLGRLAFPGAVARVAESTSRGWPQSPERRSASCASSTPSTTSTRRRAAGARRDPVAAGAGQPRARTQRASSSCTRPAGTPPTASAYWLPWLRVLVCGDYLSPVEIPMLTGAARWMPTR